jgi:calcium binding protein 39
MGGFIDFLLGRSKIKPHDVLKKLSLELSQFPTTGDSIRSLELSDADLNRAETCLAAACAGTTANVYVKKPPKPEEIEKCLNVARSTDLLLHVARTVYMLPPETRRIVSAIWGYMLKMENPKTSAAAIIFQRPMVEYLATHTAAIDSLLAIYGNSNSGGAADVTIGVMLRDATRYQKIVQYILDTESVFKLFPILTSKNFDVSADAFQTLKEVLINHKESSAPWLSANFDKFFTPYMKLMGRENGGKVDYVLARQCLSVLASVLRDRKFAQTMLQFVGREEYLKDILVLLSNPSKVVQFEAFHIFKIFAANPNKPPKVAKLLVQNVDRITKILNSIEQDRLDDQEYKQDKNAVITKISAISPP